MRRRAVGRGWAWLSPDGGALGDLRQRLGGMADVAFSGERPEAEAARAGVPIRPAHVRVAGRQSTPPNS